MYIKKFIVSDVKYAISSFEFVDKTFLAAVAAVDWFLYQQERHQARQHPNCCALSGFISNVQKIYAEFKLPCLYCSRLAGNGHEQEHNHHHCQAQSIFRHACLQFRFHSSTQITKSPAC